MTKTMRKMIMTLPVGFVMKRNLWGLLLVLALVSFASSEAQAQSRNLRVNDGKIESIYYDSDVLIIKLTNEALGYGWTGSGADDLARHALWLVERAGKSCRDVRLSKLARQIRLHCVAYSGPTGKLAKIRRHANPVNMTWRELR